MSWTPRDSRLKLASHRKFLIKWSPESDCVTRTLITSKRSEYLKWNTYMWDFWVFTYWCEAVGTVGYLSSGHGRAVSVAPSGPFIQKWADGGVMVPSSAQWQPGVSGEERATSVSIPKSPQNPSARSDWTNRAMTQRVSFAHTRVWKLRAASKKLRSRTSQTCHWN